MTKLKDKFQHYVSPEWAKELAYWGIKTLEVKAAFYWNEGKLTRDKLGYPAFTIFELLKILPEFLEYNNGEILTMRPYIELGFTVTYEAKDRKPRFEIWEATLPDALAKMTKLLIKRGYISIKNQCDGCRAGYPNERGFHRVPYPSGGMLCMADRYEKELRLYNG